MVAFRGDKSFVASWQTSFLERFGNTTTMNVGRATLAYANGSAITLPIDIATKVPVCSDTRGYFGDYDAMVLAALDPKQGEMFMRFHSDATAGCTKRWEFTGREQHVSQATYSY